MEKEAIVRKEEKIVIQQQGLLSATIGTLILTRTELYFTKESKKIFSIKIKDIDTINVSTKENNGSVHVMDIIYKDNSNQKDKSVKIKYLSGFGIFPSSGETYFESWKKIINDTRFNKKPSKNEPMKNIKQNKGQKIIWIITLLLASGLAIDALKDVYKIYNPDKNFNRTSEIISNLIETKKAEQIVYKVNDTINANNLEFIVTSAQEEKQVGSQYFESKPSEGGTYVTVQWKYENVSDEPISSFSQPRINLIDSNNIKYDADMGASANYATELKLDRKILSDLNPDISVRDAQVFEVSKEGYSKGGWSVIIKADNKEYKVNVN